MLSPSPSALLFGPQAKLPTTEQLRGIRELCRSRPSVQSFLEAVHELPSFWKLLVASDPALEQVPGLQAAQDIVRWLKGEEDEEEEDALSRMQSPSNVVYTPLTVIVQVIQYFQFLDANEAGLGHSQLLDGLSLGGAQGFCTGILPAMVVACARDEEDINVLAPVALRLALCLGAYVDLDRHVNCLETSCIVVKSHSGDGEERISELLESYPPAYVSVIYDRDHVTVTVPKSEEAQLTSFLVGNGYLARKIDTEGRFHSSVNEATLDKVIGLCRAESQLQLPMAAALKVPVRSNVDGEIIQEGSLSEIAAEILLTEVSDWYEAISETAKAIPRDSQVVVFGLSDVLPPSVQRSSHLRVFKAASLSSISSSVLEGRHLQQQQPQINCPKGAVAIVGMAAKFSGVDSLDEFWDVISSGASMCTELPPDRKWPSKLRRTKAGSPFYGTFVRDHDAFDHRFFKKSSREAAAMDPQQRLLLQAAYQAVESSGYFADRGQATPPEDVGCYIGVATTDYHDNIHSHQPTAFSALGELRAFLCGRISHHFGWTGPSITYDTACSASMVAIDAACKAIQSGQCSMALAGGVAVNTNPNLWENLRAANFLSPTGPTKPFDSNADGYCRGEGVGLVFLKSLSEALKDGDFVLGVVAGSAVNQCKNETYITVPHSPSQVRLYRNVVEQSGIQAEDITFVEAHGTGTQKGDPIEIDSLRTVFGGCHRAESVHLGSVKGNIGHCEAASGVASVIKTALMMHHGFVPPLASHQSLNPNISALEPDKMAIPRSLEPWNSRFRAAIINNYGAAGSNGAMILCQPPTAIKDTTSAAPAMPKVPLFISAHSEASLRAYCECLRSQYSSSASSKSDPAGYLSNLAYNLARKQNRSLEYSMVTSVGVSDVQDKLSDVKPEKTQKQKPVVLVFGGQTSDHVGLSQDVYRGSTIFRSHLDHCNRAIQEAGFKGIFPAIFQKEPVTDVVQLHCLFLATQYACAMTWMGSGVAPAGLVGHSFGQLTAMCIAGILSLGDAVRLVAGRATLMRKYWGDEPGSMVSLEATAEATATRVVAAVADAEIACYNGPTSHVVVGSSAAMDEVERVCLASEPPIRHRRLRVTNGFHSRFTDPLIPHLEKLVAQLDFAIEPLIPLETCSSSNWDWETVTPAQVAGHTRSPVYFEDAVKRIHARLGGCAWLEAGSNSSVTGMVRRILQPIEQQKNDNTYHGIQLNGDGALGGLADATASLWRVCPKAEFWPFHREQHGQYSHINLPPYQFEKTRHWLEWKDHAEAIGVQTETATTVAPPIQLLKLVSKEKKDTPANFSVDPRSEEFQTLVKGHAVLNQPLCPADLYVELASRAALKLLDQDGAREYIPSVEKLSIVAPLGIDPSREVCLTLASENALEWSFVFSSNKQHATGRVILTPLDSDSRLAAEFSRYEQLVGPGRAAAILADPHAEGMQGSPLIYNLFAKVVDYAGYYRGVRAVAARGSEVAAQISLPSKSGTASSMLLDPVAVDNFVQVAGIKANCLSHCPANQVFICGHIERVQPGRLFIEQQQQHTEGSGEESRKWTVVAHCTAMGDRDYLNNIYVFSGDDSRQLEMIILGVRFTRVAIASLARAIAGSNSAGQTEQRLGHQQQQQPRRPRLEQKRSASSSASVPTQKSTEQNIMQALKKLLTRVADVPADSVKHGSTFEELGIDSLMTTEIFSDVCETFGLDIPHDEYPNLSDVSSLVGYLASSKACSRAVLDDVATSSSSSSASSTSGQDLSVTFTTASSLSIPAEDDDASDACADTETRLSRIVTSQLECSEQMLPGTELEACGLDSLMAVELQNEIEEAFGVSLEVGSVQPSQTFGQLLDTVNRAAAAGRTPSSSGTQTPTPTSAVPSVLKDVPVNARRMPGDGMKTVLYKQAGSTQLFADVYMPNPAEQNGLVRPIALMIHGGGHTMLSRRDIRPKQTALLLANGFLPVSIDYRLCPEVNLVDGAMADVLDALRWVRSELPRLDFVRGTPGLRVDGEKVAVVGWSTGGTLGLQLGFTSRMNGVEPPNATLAFYCPSNYEADCWKEPNYPENTKDVGELASYDLLEGVQEHPITAYNVDPKAHGAAVGGWMSPSDPRSRIVLHMNWRGQALPVLLGGLPSRSQAAAKGLSSQDYARLPQPEPERVASISPCSQIERGNYSTPTYLVHGTRDDLIPWQQARQTRDALAAAGVPAGLGILQGAEHLFDLYRTRGKEWTAVLEGYEFVFSQLR